MEKENILRFIKQEKESDYLDFKAKDYPKEKKIDFLKDIISMANSNYEGDKYIIVGVKDKKGNNKEVIGIDEVREQAEFEQLVHENIEPAIKYEFKTIDYDDKMVEYYKISAENKDSPYMFRKRIGDGTKIDTGDCFIRGNSVNQKARRRDFDRFYNEKTEVRVMIKSFFIYIRTMDKNYRLIDGPVYAPLDINIFNKSKNKIIFEHGFLIIKDVKQNELCRVNVIGYDKNYMGSDFKLEVGANDQFLGEILLSFGSSNCIEIGLDEYGETTERFIFELNLFDTEGEHYVTRMNDGLINAEGKILHKIWQVRGEPKKNRRGIFRR